MTVYVSSYGCSTLIVDSNLLDAITASYGHPNGLFVNVKPEALKYPKMRFHNHIIIYHRDYYLNVI